MTRYLIAGLGSIGRRHLRNLMALGRSDIVLYRSHQGTLPDDELGGLPIVTDLAQALVEDRPDAVIVSNPTSLHLDVAVPAAEAGCHLLLEKPISHTLARIESLQRAVTRNQVRVVVGFQLRYHPNLCQAKRWLSDGRLGRVLTARVHFGEYLPAWHPWEDYRHGYAARRDLGGGVLRTQCHSLDYLSWLLGEVDSVWGWVGKLSDLEIEVDDTAEIGLRFSSGPLGSVHIDYCQQPPSHRLEIMGTSGTLDCDILAGTARLYSAAEKTWEEQSLPPSWERNDMFLAEMRHFVDVVESDAAPSCTLEDGIRVMRLIEAIESASRSGQRLSLRS